MRGYYGTVSHNVKATYVLYLGWFDGNPANLHDPPAVAAASTWSSWEALDAAVAAGEVTIDGDTGALQTLMGLLDTFEFWFDIVTP